MDLNRSRISVEMLQRCQGHYGDIQIIEGRPSIPIYNDALYVPVGDPRSAAGLYDCGRKLIPTGSYFRGPDLQILGSHVTPYRYADFWSSAGEETFIYCGHLHEHFGHFLLSTFSRFWPFIEPDFLKSVRIVVHTLSGVAEFLSQYQFALELFASIGLRPENFVTFRELTRIKNIAVVAPSFEETGFAHLAYAKLGNYAGARLAQDLREDDSRRPAWMSKEKLASGVRRVVNEGELTVILAQSGVDIIFPETLSLPEQVRLWRDRPVIGGFAGSAFHTGILSPGKAVVGISDSPVIMSSYPLIDYVNGTKAIYFGVTEDDMLEIENENTGFHSLKKISSPRSVAETILQAFEDLSSVAG